MDMRTGKEYETLGAALADGVPASDIANVTTGPDGQPEVRFITSGPFKGRTYKRNAANQWVRVK
jgi:hypothetical protein